MGFFGNSNKEEIIENNEIIENAVCGGLKIIKLKSFSEVGKVAELIKQGNIIAFNLENIRNEEGQRIIDYLSGATYVAGGNIEVLTDKVYASVPKGINVEKLED